VESADSGPEGADRPMDGQLDTQIDVQLAVCVQSDKTTCNLFIFPDTPRDVHKHYHTQKCDTKMTRNEVKCYLKCFVLELLFDI
jgi:hypothetical protein